MQKTLITALLGLFVIGAAATSRADVNAGISIGSDGIKSFYVAVGEEYQVPEKEIVVARERKIPDEELPVLFYIANRADVQPKAVLDLRLSGLSWMEVSLHFGLHANVFYVDVPGDCGPPYGKAFGHFKHRTRRQWREIRLADPDIINLVNLRFMSEHYNWSAEEVIKMRGKGKSFVSINDNIKKARDEQSKKTQMAQDDKSQSKAQSKSKGKGNGKKK